MKISWALGEKQAVEESKYKLEYKLETLCFK